MKARELREWASRAPPDAVISLPAKAIVDALSDIDGPGAVLGPENEEGVGSGSVFLTTEAYARRVLGGARTGKTIARWCKEGKIAPCRQLPNGDWLVAATAPPPTNGDAVSKPEPAGRDGALSLRELARRRS